MLKGNNFRNYLHHLVEYQNQLLPDNNVSKDYVILYDYLMDLLEKDEVVGQMLVRKRQKLSSVNADIFLDLTKLFNIRSFIHEPFLCLTLNGCENKRFEKNIHPFCNDKLSLVPWKIKKIIYLALEKGLSKSGSYIRGYQGDIYEINLPDLDRHESAIRLNAYSHDININIGLRLLFNYTNNSKCESRVYKPYPVHVLYSQKLAVLPNKFTLPFNVCLPKLECEMKHMHFEFVLILRIFKFLFKKHKNLQILDSELLDSIIYNEYMGIRLYKEISTSYDYLFKCVLSRIYRALKTKKFPCYWNERLNLIKYFETHSLYLNSYRTFNNLFDDFNKLREKHFLNYEEFFDFFDFKMEPYSYEVDQFGIFRSY